MQQLGGKVLIIDDDRNVADLVAIVLTEEGLAVSSLQDFGLETLQRTVEQLEPDCVLLDGGGHHGYGSSWDLAAWLHGRRRPIPVIMFTAHGESVREAEDGQSRRSRDAAFTAILAKPFELDALVEVVVRAVTGSVPFGRAREEQLHPPAQSVEAVRPRRWPTFAGGPGAF